MLKEVITPIRQSDFDTRAQYNRAWSERNAILNFIVNIMTACWSMRKESEDVERKKKSMFERIMPRSNRQGVKFVAFLNAKAMSYAKTHGGVCCPRCGYWMFPIERESNATISAIRGDIAAPMVENYCSMCGELIERVNRTSAELDAINKEIRDMVSRERMREMDEEDRKLGILADKVADRINGGY